MKVVIAGFPRVGKTTVFRSLTGLADGTTARGAVARGVIRVPDLRVDRLSEIYRPKKTTYATVRFADVQAEAEAAEKDSVLSAPLLSEVKDADAIVAVIRGFVDPFSAKPPEPEGEFFRFDDELILTDLAIVEKRAERLAKEGAQKGREHQLLSALATHLGGSKPLRAAELTADDGKLLSGYPLVSRKPLLVVLNRPDEAASQPLPESLAGAVRSRGAEAIALAGRLEREIAELPAEDQAAFLRDAGIDSSARDRFVQAAYRMLDLVSFLTTGEDEVRAWAIPRGTVAQRAAGKIHSDIEKGFIRAEVVAYEDLMRYGSDAECKKAGKARLEGKEYVVQDGDIIHFRFNV